LLDAVERKIAKIAVGASDLVDAGHSRKVMITGQPGQGAAQPKDQHRNHKGLDAGIAGGLRALAKGPNLVAQSHARKEQLQQEGESKDNPQGAREHLQGVRENKALR